MVPVQASPQTIKTTTKAQKQLLKGADGAGQPRPMQVSILIPVMQNGTEHACQSQAWCDWQM